MSESATAATPSAVGDDRRRARLIAFYLPQFYPVRENDEWWGPGFTEWTSVAGARPSFRGHRQPRIPGDLGFYDLRLPETRVAEAELAAAHGVEGFCYWHYWFGGERLLERPFAEVLSTGVPDFPFCLAWANQPWTDTWLGTGRVLQAQNYSPDDDVRHARWLVDAFADPRYISVGGRPVLVVYRPADLPDPARTADTIRGEVVRAGLAEPMILGIDAFTFGHDFREDGFDGTIGFEPNLGLLPHANQSSTLSRPWRKVARFGRNVQLGIWNSTVKVHSYRRYVERSARRRAQHTHPFFPTVFTGWDNTPRRGRGAVVMVDDDVEVFERRVGDIVAELGAVPFDERVVFVNAWNEWAEGNYLEPGLDDGLAKLEALRRVVVDAEQPAVPRAAGPRPVDGAAGVGGAAGAAGTMPNFFVIGANKAGTTALHEHLAQHPDVFMCPVKEPMYFAPGPADPVPVGDDAEPVRALAEYRELFAGVAGERAIGESSTAYISRDDTPRLIRESVPDAKLVAVLRNPLDRAFSAYCMHRQWGDEPLSFADAVNAELSGRTEPPAPPRRYLALGEYGRFLTCYREHFEPEQLRVHLFEDLVAGPGRVVRDIFGFLGVDDSFVPDTTTRRNVTQYEVRRPGVDRAARAAAASSVTRRFVPRRARTWARDLLKRTNATVPEFPDDTRRTLVEHFSSDVELTARITGRDLSSWLA